MPVLHRGGDILAERQLLETHHPSQRQSNECEKAQYEKALGCPKEGQDPMGARRGATEPKSHGPHRPQ